MGGGDDPPNPPRSPLPLPAQSQRFSAARRAALHAGSIWSSRALPRDGTERMPRRRRNSGWVLRQKVEGGIYTVRFWLGGRESERSTGTSDRGAAASEAARI